LLIKTGVSSKIDDSGTSVGRRYARTDECGIPFAVTVDHETLKEHTVTVRELETMKQVRVKVRYYLCITWGFIRFQNWEGFCLS
jgi:glycyl-tRNA synthetase